MRLLGFSAEARALTPRLAMLGLVAVTILLAGANLGLAQDEGVDPEAARLFASINWQEGPCKADIGSVAEIDVPAGYMFTDAQGAAAWSKLTQNPPDPSEIGLLVPEELEWFITFSFDETGYVEDSEKDSLDADALLDSIRTGNDQANEYRREQGWGEMFIVGWYQKPFYNQSTRRLSWAITGGDGTDEVVNYNTRLLGRRGVMSAKLVDTPQSIGGVLPKFDNLLTGYRYKAGQRYEEFRSGDKVAQYGLGALILGGGAVVAAKSGLLARFGKLIVIGVVGALAALRKLFGFASGK